MDPEYTRDIMEWEAPLNVEEVRSFMGLASYYRRFIRNFSHIACPIKTLRIKGKKFEWIEECATSFEQLKELLTNATILKIADLDKEFVVCTDSYKGGICRVLDPNGS